MTVRLSRRVTRMQPSASIAAKQRVTELQAQGKEIIDFTIGEPDMDTPAHIVQGAIDAMRGGDTHYTPTAGVAPLRQAIADKLRRDAGHDYTAAQVIVGSGAKQLINESFAATLDDGDEVIIPAPYWVSYPDIVTLYDGVPVVVPTTAANDFKLTPQALAAALTPRTRWVVLNAPGNPGGAIYTRDELRALADVLAGHPEVMVMTDDIYEYLAYDQHRHVNLVAAAPDLAARTLLINGFSKSYAMTGWRIGYAAGPQALINAMGKLIGQSTTCVSSIAQAGALTALKGDQEFIEETRQVYEHRRNVMYKAVSAIPGVDCRLPQGAFYLFPSVQALLGKRTPGGQVVADDRDLVMYLLDEAGVAVMDGSAYGMPGHLRLSFATSLQTIERGCARMAQACARLA
ncbi:Aspartate aminotransferase [plant metagenome]|uniref:Aspartate aminotransferase n=1 Tax=plant metagenome TaxID=1297885 RepID=A0A484S5W5_9ZZZZ